MNPLSLNLVPFRADQSLAWGAPTVQEQAPQHGPLEGQKKWADGVPMIDTEQGQLQTVLDACVAHRDVRRPDGRRAPILLVAEAYWELRRRLNFATDEFARVNRVVRSLEAELGRRKTLLEHLREWWRTR